MCMEYRVAIVGAGGIAARHWEALEQVVQLKPVAIADLQMDRSRELSSQYSMQPYSDYRQMIETEKPDICIITLPHFLHREAAIFCVDAIFNAC